MKRLHIGIGIGLLIVGGMVAAAPRRKPVVTTAQLRASIQRVQPLHEKLGPPGPMDWLASHDEPGQSFEQYVRSRPITPTGKRKVLYIQPLGEFTQTEEKIVALTAEYLGLFFNLPVRTNKAILLTAIPDSARRGQSPDSDGQILTTYVLEKLLKPQLPGDAAAMIAFTASDLWPGEGWSFVFGHASYRDRVGVWSMHRFGDPEHDTEGFDLCLRRTIKTAVHKTGHMFSILHCTAYECCMCGSNHLEEADGRPLYLCPECNAKVCWATQIDRDAVSRYRRLQEFCRRHDWEVEGEFFAESIRRLEE